MIRLLVLLVAGGLPASLLVACASVPPAQARAPHSASKGPLLDGAAGAAPDPSGTSMDVASPARPRRSAPPSILPDLEQPASPLPSLTLEVETLDESGATSARRTITRTATLTHVKPLGSEVEWLFARNPVDGRRVSAMQTDHQRKVIIEYSESELRSAEIVRGWADVIYLGVDIAALGRMAPTGREKTLSGFQFEEYLPSSSSDGSGSLWWSRAASVPLRSSLAGSKSQLSLELIRPAVDASLLQDPRRRFPSYSVLDVADFREKHHEH